MRELTKHEIATVSGSGFVADFINQRLDAPARDFGTQFGENLGRFAFQTLTDVTSKIESGIRQLTTFFSGLFR
ncbi:hypothetical protein [Entomohabitans teleogrylli]|uniref:hypothetical protein n=1 Tax=Entomohabitans teleogrylli TaxID=1384589 RepID=UPI00073D6850|nr:hypothetical protein [Entomohabitans teleogrylli]